jgi:hypothetical protein
MASRNLRVAMLGIALAIVGWILMDRPDDADSTPTSISGTPSGSIESRAEGDNVEDEGRIESSGAEVSGDAKSNWWEDPETLERFLAEYQRQLPKAFADQMGFRSGSVEFHTRLKVNLENAIRVAKENLLFNEIETSDFEGLVVDSLRSSTGWLNEQTNRYVEWQRDKERGKGSLPSLEQMRGEIRYYPPEMVLSRILEKPVGEINWSNEQVSKVSAARNSLLRELALIESHLWEVAPAATRAADAFGLETGLDVDFDLIIPEWRAFNEMIDAEVDRYLFELDLIGTEVNR